MLIAEDAYQACTELCDCNETLAIMFRLLNQLLQPKYFALGPAAFVRGIKTHSGAKKRFHVTSSGSIQRARAGRQHNTGKHSRNLIRGRGFTAGISEPSHEKNIR
jgi:ribosomal protein L35